MDHGYWDIINVLQNFELNVPSREISLASASPRRKQLMSEAGYTFITYSPDIDEDKIFSEHEINQDLPMYVSELKAEKALELYPDYTVISADTAVFLGNQVFNKPKDDEEAKEMLRTLSGKTHSVVTGVTILNMDKKISFSDVTLVTFKDFSEEEINFYIQNYKPFDKAGSYGAQDWLGYIGITNIQGSYYNVMGLPIHLVYQHLNNIKDGK